MAKINKYANIYDKNGELVRPINPETGKLDKYTLEEVEKLVDDLTEKVKENPENKDLRIQLNHTQSYLFYMYNNMSREDLLKRLSIAKEVVDKAKTERNEAEQQMLSQINEEIDKLKDAYESEYTEYEEV